MPNFFKKEPEKKEIKKSFLPSRGVFGEKMAVSRIDFLKKALKGGKFRVPGGGGKIIDKPQIKKMIEEDFPKTKFGGQISRKEFEQRMKELQLEKYKAKTAKEKFEIEQKIKFYRRRILK
jgi:hypothetical protein